MDSDRCGRVGRGKAKDRRRSKRLRADRAGRMSRKDLLRQKLAYDAPVMRIARERPVAAPDGDPGTEILPSGEAPRGEIGVSMAITAGVRRVRPADAAVVVKRRGRGHRKQVTGQNQPNAKTSPKRHDSPK